MALLDLPLSSLRRSLQRFGRRRGFARLCACMVRLIVACALYVWYLTVWYCRLKFVMETPKHGAGKFADNSPHLPCEPEHSVNAGGKRDVESGKAA